jgi:hypothetical protein
MPNLCKYAHTLPLTLAYRKPLAIFVIFWSISPAIRSAPNRVTNGLAENRQNIRLFVLESILMAREDIILSISGSPDRLILEGLNSA